jgi:GDP-L-fucose synthase
MKIYLAGHKGLVGSAISRAIDSEGRHTWIGRTRSDLNLLDKRKVFHFFDEHQFDAVILAAAKVGGIRANMNFPVEFLSENLEIQLNVMEAAHKSNVKKFLFLGSSCIYPKFATQPIKESELLTGILEKTNEPYAIAKIAGIKLVESYRKEFGHSWISAMPTNLYGPNDNFDLESSHVLPAMIAKFHIAKTEGKKSVSLWGTGSPKREFLHVDDMARASIFLLEKYDSDQVINVGTGQDLAISELAEIVSSTVGYSGEINWDTSVPDGTPRKLLDTSRINDLGWKPTISIKKGIESTYEWFLANMAH